MRARTEHALLGAATLAVVAFMLSFAFGVDGGAALRAGSMTDSVATRDFLERGRAPRVEVLNGARRSGFARAATDQLRAAGFDVVFFGNARTPTDTSYVLDRTGRPDVARAVAERLGIQRVSTRVDTTLFLETTVVLGKDWAPAGAPARRP